MTTILTQVPHVEEFILSEANGFLSREEVDVTLGVAAIKSGTVMGVNGDGKYVPYSNAADDGSEVAAGILYTGLPIGTGDVKAVVFARDCEVVRAALTGLDAAGEADLAAKGIIVRGKYATK
jgi:hypothetical protein